MDKILNATKDRCGYLFDKVAAFLLLHLGYEQSHIGIELQIDSTERDYAVAECNCLLFC